MTTTFLATRTLPSLADDEGLARYLRNIRQFPVLTAEQENSLARLWQQQGDRQAAHTLVTSHLRLVAKVAMGYRGYGLPVSDLIAEGNMGMMQAVRKFDPDRGFRLATYALWWIKASIQEYILHSWSLVKMGTTAAQKKLFFNLRKLKTRLHKLDSDSALNPAQVTHIASALDVSEQDVRAMDGRLAAGDYSLNTTLNHDGEESLEWQDTLADTAPTPENRLAENDEQAKRSTLLGNALATLNDRERAIFVQRRLREEPRTLEGLAESYGISRERVRQIETRAFEKVQQFIQGNYHPDFLQKKDLRHGSGMCLRC